MTRSIGARVRIHQSMPRWTWHSGQPWPRDLQNWNNFRRALEPGMAIHTSNSTIGLIPSPCWTSVVSRALICHGLPICVPYFLSRKYLITQQCGQPNWWPHERQNKDVHLLFVTQKTGNFCVASSEGKDCWASPVKRSDKHSEPAAASVSRKRHLRLPEPIFQPQLLRATRELLQEITF